jgi:hypothetical protein
VGVLFVTAGFHHKALFHYSMTILAPSGILEVSHDKCEMNIVMVTIVGLAFCLLYSMP